MRRSDHNRRHTELYWILPHGPAAVYLVSQCRKELTRLVSQITQFGDRFVVSDSGCGRLRVKVVWLGRWCWGMQECGPVTKCFSGHGVTFTGVCTLYHSVGSYLLTYLLTYSMEQGPS